MCAPPREHNHGNHNEPPDNHHPGDAQKNGDKKKPEPDHKTPGDNTPPKAPAEVKNPPNSSSGGNPPAGNPPAGNPPAGNPPAGNPPAGNPPAGNPPAGNPPAGNPPAGNPPASSSAGPAPKGVPAGAAPKGGAPGPTPSTGGPAPKTPTDPGKIPPGGVTVPPKQPMYEPPPPPKDADPKTSGLTNDPDLKKNAVPQANDPYKDQNGNVFDKQKDGSYVFIGKVDAKGAYTPKPPPALPQSKEPPPDVGKIKNDDFKTQIPNATDPYIDSNGNAFEHTSDGRWVNLGKFDANGKFAKGGMPLPAKGADLANDPLYHKPKGDAKTALDKLSNDAYVDSNGYVFDKLSNGTVKFIGTIDDKGNFKPAPAITPGKGTPATGENGLWPVNTKLSNKVEHPKDTYIDSTGSVWDHKIDGSYEYLGKVVDGTFQPKPAAPAAPPAQPPKQQPK